MEITADVNGLQETIYAMKGLRTEAPPTIRLAVTAGMLPITQAMRAYPAQRPTRYVRTFVYRDKISNPIIVQEPGSVLGTINSAAPYGIYVRGDGEVGGYRQAWMHVGYWVPLVDILTDLIPPCIEIIDQQLGLLIGRVGLSL